jgi:hypothetical protein
LSVGASIGVSVGDLQARGKYITRSRKRTQSTFPARAAREYECSVKVFNSSVEIRVEKHSMTIEITCHNHAFLLFAQVHVQTCSHAGHLK